MIVGIKNYRSFPGGEGYGFSASLYIDGKRVGEITDYGNGGEWRWSILEGCHDLVAEFEDLCRALPPAEWTVEDKTYSVPMDSDIWIEENLLMIADAKYMNRGKILFMKPNKQIYTMGNYRKVDHERIEKALAKKYPGSILLNGKPVEKEINNA